jgi:hypothetical protein
LQVQRNKISIKALIATEYVAVNFAGANAYGTTI